MIVENTGRLPHHVYSHGIQSSESPIISMSKNFSDFINIDFSKIRTDSYTKDHTGKHILFAGCSVTHGVGLPDQKDNWTNIVYNKINEDDAVSGFYSVAYPGHSVPIQVSLIIRYISEYGTPDVIFFNMPPLSRTFTSNQGMIYTSQIEKEQEEDFSGSMLLAKHASFESYLALHEYCLVKGIRLISFTWTDNSLSINPGCVSSALDGEFDSFYTPKIRLEDFLEKYLMNNSGEYMLLGTDQSHPGIAPHAYYASTALEAYFDFPA